MIRHQLRDYDMVASYQFRVLNLVVKNQIKEGHELRIKIYDQDMNKLDCYFEVEWYKSLEDLE